jgi:hypothetical protein
MSKSAEVKITSSSGIVQPCFITYSRAPNVTLTAESPAFAEVSFKASNLFDALTEFRLYLEKQGYMLLCNVARRDTYISPMAKEMGGGIKVYVLHPGQQARMNEMVDSLGEAPPELVTTVAHQRNAYEQWLRSLWFLKDSKGNEIPIEAINEAKAHPNGWVYKIDGRFGPDDYVPPECIVGAWKVDANGELIGEYVENPNYHPGFSRRFTARTADWLCLEFPSKDDQW